MKQKICPIDTLCKIKGVVLFENDTFYSCTLNQTDLESNKNKFYIMQIINDSTSHHLYIRYGRVGEKGKIIDKIYQDKVKAKLEFIKQFYSKTGNRFGNDFVKKSGKYFMADVQYEIEKDDIKDERPEYKTQSKLCDRQNFLMELFTNKKTMENTLISLSIDPKKMPLGKISKSQLDEAQKVLTNIKKLLPNESESEDNSDITNTKSTINNTTDKSDKCDITNTTDAINIDEKPKKRGRPKKTDKQVELPPQSQPKSENSPKSKKKLDVDKSDNIVQSDESNKIIKSVEIGKNIIHCDQFTDLSSEFYTLVPYSCGRNLPPIINNKETLGKFVTMLDDLKNLEVAIKVTKQGGDSLDNVYDSLEAKIKPIEKNSEIWNIISDYIKNTHGATHRTKIQLVDIYGLERNNESKSIEDFLKKIGNRQLLWHGSRMTNFCSIIKNGLLLNPETLGVYISGKMFGAGIYLASSFSKSFNYCSSETSNGYACLLLCEAALGKQLEKIQSDSYLSPIKLKNYGNYNSTWGKGQNTPSSFINYENVKIPNGKLEKSNINTCLLYDEYIVYDTNQISLKYLVIVKSIK